MLSAELHPCTEHGCTTLTLWHRCPEHERPEERELRDRADTAVVEFSLARDHWLAALAGGDPVDVTATSRVLAHAHAQRVSAEHHAGLVTR
jgi:hypothetical protein